VNKLYAALSLKCWAISKEIMQAVIMAGGLATRLRPLTDDAPKSMISIEGKPFLQYQIELLNLYGVKDIVLCLGYKGKKIEDYFSNGRKFRAKIIYSYEEEKLLGTGGALKLAEPYIDEKFFLIWGDSYVRLDYKEMYDFHLKNSCDFDVTMAIFYNYRNYDKGNIVYKNEKIKKYEKDSKHEMKYIDAGVMVINKKILEEIPSGKVFQIENLFSELAKKGKMKPFLIKKRYYEIGSLNGLNQFAKFVKRKQI
jgi:NDP-sugar pyrophosphorylase family protein